MDKLKKSIVFVIVLCLVTANIVYADVDAENVVPVDSGVTGKLSALGLWSGQNLNENVTRAAFAQLVSKMLGLNEITLPDSADMTNFYDVTRKNPAYNDIAVLCGAGIINSNGGSFRPDDPVTYAEAVKMLVSALGYDIYAQAKGGFPTGYMITARENDIIPKDFGKAGNSFLTYADAALILNDTIEAEILEHKGFGEKQQYQVKDDATVLSEYHHIYVLEGVLEAVGKTRVNIGDDLKRDQAEIAGEVFQVGFTAPEKLLGYNVKAYYYKEKDSDKGSLLYIEENGTKNSVLVLDHKSIDYFKLGALYYWKDPEAGKLATVDIPPSICTVMNGRFSSDFTKEDFENADSVIFIDNDNDGTYDVMKMVIEEIFVVSGFDFNENKVYDQYMTANNVLNLKEDSGKQVDITDDAGNPVGLEAIGEGTVLTVCRDKAETKIEVTVTNRQFSGTVDEFEKTDDWDDAQITVGGNVYAFSKNAVYIGELNRLKVGDEYTFSLDSHGKIAALENGVQHTEQYGYLLTAQKQYGVSGVVELKIFTKENQFQVLKSAKSMKIDGVSQLKDDEIVNALRHKENGEIADNIESKPVRYQLNADGEIYVLDTPYKGPDEDPGSQLDYGNDTLTRYKEFTGGQYEPETNIFEGQLRVDNQTTVICIPNDSKYGNDGDHYAVTDYGYFEKKDYVVDGGAFQAYDVSKDRTAKLVIIRSDDSGGSAIGNNTRVTVVTRITQGINPEGDRISILQGYQDGKEISVPFSSDFGPEKHYKAGLESVVSTIKRGDLIRYGVNKKGEINAYDKIFSLRDEDDPAVVRRGNEVGSISSPDTNPSLIAVTTDVYSSHHYTVGRVFYGDAYYYYGIKFLAAYGTVMYKEGNQLLINGQYTNKVEKFNALFNAGSVKIYVIDEEKDKVYQSDINEVLSVKDSGENIASKVIFTTYSGKPGALFVIKRKQ